MENSEDLLSDAERILASIKRCNAREILYMEQISELVWRGWGSEEFNLITTTVRHGMPAETLASPVSACLAGMVFAERCPKDLRVCHGVELAELELRLEDLFPQLRVVYHHGVQFRIDPITPQYWNKIKSLLPAWAQNSERWRVPASWSPNDYVVYDYAVTGSTYVRLEIASDLTRVELGAFRWKTQKTT